MGRRYSSMHIAACVSALPRGSALRARYEESSAWDIEHYQLHGIMCALAGKELPYPWEGSRQSAPWGDIEGLDMDDFVKWRSQTFKDVDACQL